MSNQFNPLTGEYQEQHNLIELNDLQVDEVFKTVMRRVYLWMALGLLVTTGAALATVMTPPWKPCVQQYLCLLRPGLWRIDHGDGAERRDPKIAPCRGWRAVLCLCSPERDYPFGDFLDLSIGQHWDGLLHRRPSVWAQ